MVLIEGLLSGAREHRLRFSRPMVTLSYAQSLDGCITARRGSLQVLSGPQAMEMTHRLRALHSAILIGIGTVLADDPRLNVRLVEGPDPQPVILDSRLRLPVNARVLHSSNRSPWVMATQHAQRERQVELEAVGARVIRLEEDANEGVNLHALMGHLAKAEVDSLMVEGGARVITSFLRESLVDQVVLTISPLFLGGLHALDSGLEEGFFQGKDYFPKLKQPAYHQSGQDLIVWGEMDWSPG